MTSFQQEVIALYASVGRATDLNNVVWSARFVYDAIFIGYPQSRIKHLNELKAELGIK